MRCQQCGHEFEALLGEPCPRCGHSSPVPPPSSPPGGTPYAPPPAADHSGAPPPPPPEPPCAGIPWERERSFGALLQTLQGVLIQPSRTFGEADPQAGIGWALGYAMIFGMVGAVFQATWESLMRLAGLPGTEILDRLGPEFEGFMPFLESPLVPVLGLLLAPVSILIGLFFWAAILHLLLLLFGGAQRGFEATFRVVAYASGSTSLFQVVPICGWMIAPIWALVVGIFGLRELHRTTTGKAVAAVLLPIGLCCVCLVLGWVLFLAAAVSLMGQS